MFVNLNLNPKKRKVGDCVIRAIAKAENKNWLEIFDELTDIARKEYSVLDDKVVYSKYLKKYQKIDVMHYIGNCRYRWTVEEICKWEGIYIISLAGHITVVEDGKCYDIWDCTGKCAYEIWKVR